MPLSRRFEPEKLALSCTDKECDKRKPDDGNSVDTENATRLLKIIDLRSGIFLLVIAAFYIGGKWSDIVNQKSFNENVSAQIDHINTNLGEIASALGIKLSAIPKKAGTQ